MERPQALRRGRGINRVDRMEAAVKMRKWISTAKGEGAVGRLDLAAMFGNDRPVEVDLGCGKGLFLVREAAARKDVNFLGVDRLTRKLERTLRRAREAGLENVRVLRCDVLYLVEELLPPACIQAFHVYFPDPWPKKRHHKNRFLTAELIEALAGVLLPRGRVLVLTDHADYFEEIKADFARDPRFRPEPLPAAGERSPTDFEEDFSSLSMPVFGAGFRKEPSAPEGSLPGSS